MKRQHVRGALVAIFLLLGGLVGTEALRARETTSATEPRHGMCLKACWCGWDCHRSWGHYGYHKCANGHSY